MATINDPENNQYAVKVSSQGSMMVTTGDDGFPTFFTKIYHPRLTSAMSAGSILWAIRAPVNRTLIVRGGRIKISVDTASTTEVGIDMVRFTLGDPTGGDVLIPTRMRSQDADPITTVIRAAKAASPLTLAASATQESTAAGLFHLAIPGIAGAQDAIDLSEWTGLELLEGEGLLIAIRGAAAPVGFQTSGYLLFSEKG